MKHNNYKVINNFKHYFFKTSLKFFVKKSFIIFITRTLIFNRLSKSNYFMKHLLLFMVIIFSCNLITAQNSFPPERVFVIANLENNELESTDFLHPNLSIKPKISRSLKLDSRSFELVNPKVTNELGRGWFLTYEFNTSDYSGVYKEELQLRGNQLVITESRNAIMAIATNCNTIEFINNNRDCECTSKKDDSLESNVTYRLFTSSN